MVPQPASSVGVRLHWPAAEHALQLPVQAFSQHTPSTQKPSAH
jgi:hypothetical protein